MSELKLTTDKVRARFLDEPAYWLQGTGGEWFPDPTKKEFDIWLAEVKAQAWDEGAFAEFAEQSANYPLSLEKNPHRLGLPHTHTRRSSFGDSYCLTCSADLEDTE